MDQCPLPSRDPSGGLVIITSPFGMRWGRLHAGNDLGSTDGIEVGTPIGPPVPGKVARIAYDGPFRPPNNHTAGHNLWFEGDDGSRWKMFHLNRVTVSAGQHVSLADQIAEVGASGTQAAHLHLEKHAGSWSNPVDFTAELRTVMAEGRFFRTSLPTTPSTPPPGKDWLDMATAAEVEKLVRRIVQEELINKDARDTAFHTVLHDKVMDQLAPVTTDPPVLRQLVEQIHNQTA